MSSQPSVQPYLFFAGRCEDALTFYGRALGARTTRLMRFREAPDPPPPGVVAEGWDDKVMHAEFTVGAATLMASDGCGDAPAFAGFSLSLNVATAEAADRVFTALAEGGEVGMPLGATFWSPRFGMVTDRFGVAWMVNVTGTPGA